MTKKTRLVVALAMLVSTSAVTPIQATFAGECKAQKSRKNGVCEEVLINASPKVVWKCMQEQRKLDPDSAYVKPVGDSLVEQKFVFPSPFGSAECVLHLSEKSAERVDFQLISSEDLKAMEGSWILTPTEDGHTKLSLSTYCEPDMMLPRMVVNGIVSHRSKRNLTMVKKLAESPVNKAM